MLSCSLSFKGGYQMNHQCKAGRISALLLGTVAIFSLAWSQDASAFPARFAVGPDSNQELVVSAIRSARHELLINIYQLDAPAIVEAILDKINQGITVNLLVEASPVGGIGSTERRALNKIESAIQARGLRNQHLYMMGVQGRGEHRRYRFDHAKYIVIDSSQVFVSSENFTSSGHTQAGQVGNRGWDALLSDSALAQRLTTIFQEDTDPRYNDVREYEVFSTVELNSRDSAPRLRDLPAYPAQSGEVQAVSLVTSPQSLDGIVEFIRSARHQLRIEQMSLPLNWRENSEYQDPIVTELVNAANRGVRVQVLLNDDQVFKPSHPRGDEDHARGNELTVQYLNNHASRQGLPLEARIVNVSALQITYIHNKGMIADNQGVFVSSINGTRNSIMNNREVAVALSSRDAAAYFTPVFDFDWSQSDPHRVEAYGWIGIFNSINPGAIWTESGTFQSI